MAGSRKSGKDAAKPPSSRAGKTPAKTRAKTAGSGTKSVKEAKGKETKEEKQAAERFVEDLLVRGEAVLPDEHGGLPPGATHEIVTEPGGGKTPTVKRRRFSAY